MIPEAAVEESDAPEFHATDVRAMVRLLGEMSAHARAPSARQRFFMEKLCALIAADAWTWAVACMAEGGKPPGCTVLFSGGFSPEQFARWQEAWEHPETTELHGAILREAARTRSHLTRRLERLDPAARFRQTATEPVILSVRPGSRQVQTVVGIYRRPGGSPFLPRDVRIAHLLLTEAPGLDARLPPLDLLRTVRSLAPRERITLNLLLAGQSRRQIAGFLGLSYHTVDGYVKVVYQRFHAHSQPTLIARFHPGDEAGPI